MKTNYDIVIAGFGAAGGQLLHQFVRRGLTRSKSILVVDKLSKTENDRTWCYWEKGEGLYDHILSAHWEKMAFALKGETCIKDGQGWKYKQLEAHRFYAFIKELALPAGVQFIQADVLNHHEKEDHVEILTSAGTICSQLFFSSIADMALLRSSYTSPWLYQHFVGWFVRTEKPIFNPQVATLMDFSVSQRRTEFMYMLPDSDRTALLEHTLFSENLLSHEEYESALIKYLQQLNCGSYEICRKERGVIPMTAYPFHQRNTRRVTYIGSAGGWTRPSTGYTFRLSGIMAERLAEHIKGNHTHFARVLRPGRGIFYDRVMLDLLQRRNDLGPYFLFQVYVRNPLHRVFRFLDGTSSLTEELWIVIKSSPRIQLLKSVYRVLTARK